MHRPRKPRLEPLEPRTPAHADINLDGSTTAADALEIINHIERRDTYQARADVNQDGRVSALDALLVINDLARPKPAAEKITFYVDADTYGLTQQEIRAAIVDAFRSFEDINPRVDFVIVQDREKAEYRITSAELYIGNGYHAKGWVRPGIGGRDIQIHSGHISAHQSPTGSSFWWQPFPTSEILRRVIVHEMGHALDALRWNHTSDYSCAMHIDARPQFCPAEVDRILSAW